MKRIIGSILILAGILVFCYPIGKQLYAAHEQKKMMTDIKTQIKRNIELSEKTEPSGSDFKEDHTEELTKSTEEEFENLPLEESEQRIKEQPEEIYNRLNGQEVIGIIEIEKIDLIYAVVEGSESWNLGVAVGHMKKTASIGALGNCVIAGHRGGSSGPYFKHIDQLKKGDIIKLTDAFGAEYQYSVTKSFLVEPTEIWVTKGDDSSSQLTLITCENSGRKRLIVQAELIKDDKK